MKESQQFRFAWQIYIVALIMRLILVEQGYRAAHDNFCWGYYYGILLVFFSSIVILIKDGRELIDGNSTKKKNIILITEAVALIIHFIFGIHFFNLLYIGCDYRL